MVESKKQYEKELLKIGIEGMKLEIFSTRIFGVLFFLVKILICPPVPVPFYHCSEFSFLDKIASFSRCQLKTGNAITVS